MNQYESQMIQSLARLKNEFGAFEIKAEFEAEASRMEELIRLKDISSRLDLPLIIKTGGVEAITDTYNALNLGAKSVVAPMAETAFALQKFLNSIKNNISDSDRKDTEFHFNMETITAFKNLDQMLRLEDIILLNGMTIGRVDLTASMGYSSDYANSEEIYLMCEYAFSRAREKDLKCALGGAISPDSIDFITSLIKQGLIDKFETRKVVFDITKVSDINAAINEAVKFELLWLKSKKETYSARHSEDDKRIAMLESRLKEKQLFVGKQESFLVK